MKQKKRVAVKKSSRTVVKKKIKKVKKVTRKTAKKKISKSVAKPRAQFAKAKAAGVVTHFFSAILVAIIKSKMPISIGDALNFKGATTDFKETVKSMQYDHAPIRKSKKGQEVGIKVK